MLFISVFDPCTLCMYSMYSKHILYEWTDGADGAISALLFFGAISELLFLSKPNERNFPEILFIWTLARRVRNARNFQEIPFSWTYQFVEAAGICLLQAQPKSKCTDSSRNVVL